MRFSDVLEIIELWLRMMADRLKRIRMEKLR